MKKVCRRCLKVFKGESLLDCCPLAVCKNGELMDVDDLLVDVIIELWKCNIHTRQCCAGHIYKRSFRPYIMFDYVSTFHWNWDLFKLRTLFVGVAAGKDSVSVKDVIDRDGVPTFVVSGETLSDDTDSIQRLRSQMAFVEYLYHAIDAFRKVEKTGLADWQ